MKTKENKNIQWFHTGFDAIDVKEAVSPKAQAMAKGTIIKGYASTNAKDRGNDIVEPTAFEKSIRTHYKNNSIILFAHNDERPIGKALAMYSDHKGLEIEAVIIDDQVEPKIQAGILKTFSIGYIPTVMEFRDGEDKVLDPAKDWEQIWFGKDTKRIIKELDLVEISVVSCPMNPEATFTLAKSVKSYFDRMAEEGKEKFNSLNPDNMKKKNLLEDEKKDGGEDEEKPKDEEKEDEDNDKEEGEEGDKKDEKSTKPEDEKSEEGADDEKDDDAEAGEKDGEEDDESDGEGDDESEESEDAEKGDAGEKDEEKSVAKIESKALKLALKAINQLKAENAELKKKLEAPAKQAVVYGEDRKFAGRTEEKKADPKVENDAPHKGFKDALIAAAN